MVELDFGVCAAGRQRLDAYPDHRRRNDLSLDVQTQPVDVERELCGDLELDRVGPGDVRGCEDRGRYRHGPKIHGGLQLSTAARWRPSG